VAVQGQNQKTALITQNKSAGTIIQTLTLSSVIAS
jgi:hypothetical protein